MQQGIVEWWPVLAGLVGVGIAYGILVMKQRAMRTEAGFVEKAHGNELQRLEARINGLSKSVVAHQIDTQGRLSRMEAVLEAIRESLASDRNK